jgi:hypothetical protein
MGIVALDEIAVVAVHGSHQVSERRAHPLRQAASKSGGRGCDFDGKINELPACQTCPILLTLRSQKWGEILRCDGRIILPAENAPPNAGRNGR